MSFLPPDELSRLISAYGYWLIALVVGLESMGLPLPGETTIILAALYAGTTHELDIWFVIAAAASGAILGDNVGYWIGRRWGFRLLVRYGRLIGMTQERIKLGQYLFLRHGGKIVFCGRFVAVLRALAAILAGVNCMSWPRFLLFNAAGGLVWTGVFGLGAYYLGEEVHRVAAPVAGAIALAAVVLVIAALLFIRRHEEKLLREAQWALPGPAAAQAAGCDPEAELVGKEKGRP